MLVVIRGAGDIATGIALRLYRCGFRLVLCEVSQPTDIRRTVCFAEAVRLGRTTVEGVEARRAALKDTNRTFGYPSIVNAAALAPGDSRMRRFLFRESFNRNSRRSVQWGLQ